MIREKNYGRLVAYSAVLVVLLIGVGAGVYYTLYVLKVIPVSATTVVQLAVAGALGFLAIIVLGREVRSVSSKVLGERRGGVVFAAYRFVAYVVLGLVLLAIAGVSGTELLAGGTFAGLVLGLAGQTVLSNYIAGLMVILARPFEVDDRVTIFTWQFGTIAPTYPPKFYSSDLLMPGYTGMVKEIGLAYTTVNLDEGPVMKVPNNILIQAAVVSHGVQERWVRTRYEVPASVNPKQVLEEVAKVVRKNEWVTRPDTVQVTLNAATSSVYVVSVDAVCRGQFEDLPRSSILLDLVQTVSALKGDH